MPAMLRHKPTGDLYVYTEIMAKRADMEFVDVPEITPTEAPPASTPKKRDKKTIEDTVDFIFERKQ